MPFGPDGRVVGVDLIKASIAPFDRASPQNSVVDPHQEREEGQNNEKGEKEERPKAVSPERRQST